MTKSQTAGKGRQNADLKRKGVQTAGDRGRTSCCGKGLVPIWQEEPPATSGSTGEKTELEELELELDNRIADNILGLPRAWDTLLIWKCLRQAEQRGYEASCDYDRCDALKERNAELIAKDKFYLDKLDKLKSENTKLKEHSFLLGLANSYITCMGAEPYVSRDKEIEAYNRSEGHRIEDPKRPYFNEHINRLKSENEKLRKKLKKKLK